MWILTMRSPEGEPQEYVIHPGKNTIGRSSSSDIAVLDPSASRMHAEIFYDAVTDKAYVSDLNSMNGTFVNREQILQNCLLKSGDIIRIGEYLLTLISSSDARFSAERAARLGTHSLTRDYMLESLDQHAILIHEVATRLNTIFNIETACKEVSAMVERLLVADKCDLILAEDFQRLSELGYSTTIAQQAIEQCSAIIVQNVDNPAMGHSGMLLRIRTALCVPLLSENRIIGLLYAYKTQPESRPFDQSDMQLTVAIGHQISLAILRMEALKQSRREEEVRCQLSRFLPPNQVQASVAEYLKTGQMPPLAERKLTILSIGLRGSVQWVERLGSQRFGVLLNHLYQDLREAIFEQAGVLVKGSGDELMAVFGMGDVPDPEGGAVQAAINIQKHLQALNESEGVQIEAGFGISTGQATAGILGAEECFDYVLFGAPASFARSIQNMAKASHVLICPTTRQAIEGRLRLVEAGYVNTGMPGDSMPGESLGVYEVLGDQ